MVKGIYRSYLYVDRSGCEVPARLQDRKRGRREWLEDFADTRTLHLGGKLARCIPISRVGLEVVELHYIEVGHEFTSDEEAAAQAKRIGNTLVDEWLEMQDPQDPLTHLSDTLARLSAIDEAPPNNIDA